MSSLLSGVEDEEVFPFFIFCFSSSFSLSSSCSLSELSSSFSSNSFF